MVHARPPTSLALACALTLGLAVGARLGAEDAPATPETYDMERIGAAIRAAELIRRDSLNQGDVDLLEMLRDGQDALDGTLDRYSRLLDEDGYRALRADTHGEFGGVGLVLGLRSGSLTVLSVIERAPAAKAGVKPGDRIVAIAGESTETMSMADAVHRLKGEPGTRVHVTLSVTGTGELREVTVVRGRIQVPSVRDATVLERHGLGYLRITHFHDFTARQLVQALRGFGDHAPQGIVLDLRDNPGGAMEAAVDVCGLFLPGKSLVIRTEGRRAAQSKAYRTTRGDGEFVRPPLALIVNGGTASAAEITAGCLQDWGRAKLVGDPTFGKGTAQNVVGLPDGSGLRLTTAAFFLPKGRAVQDAGIEPDVPVVPTRDDVQAMFAQLGTGPLPRADALERDPYVRTAIEALGGTTGHSGPALTPRPSQPHGTVGPED